MGIVRFFLALAIIQYHIGTPTLSLFLNNNTTIAAFFVISGFSVAYAVSKKYAFTKKGLLAYYKNRLLRIYPLYFIALMAALMIQLWIYPRADMTSLAIALNQLKTGTVVQTGHYIFENLTLCNLWHAWTITPPTIPLIVLPAWTLLIEFWFYLLAPFLNRLSNKWLLGVFCLSMIVRYITFHHLLGLHTMPDNQFFPNQLAYFVMGILSYRWSERLIVKKQVHAFIVLVAMSCLILFGYSVSATGITHWLFLVVLSLSLPSIRPFDSLSPTIKFLGEVSYSLFLFHLPLVWLGMTYFSSQITLSIIWYLIIIVSCIGSYLLVRPQVKKVSAFRLSAK